MTDQGPTPNNQPDPNAPSGAHGQPSYPDGTPYGQPASPYPSGPTGAQDPSHYPAGPTGAQNAQYPTGAQNSQYATGPTGAQDPYQGYPNQGYAAQPGPGQGYAPQPGYDPYAQQAPAGYGQQPGYPAAYPQGGYGTPAPRSQTLGLVGLGLVVVCAILMTVAMVVIGRSLGEYVMVNGMTEADISTTNPEFLAWANTLQGWAYAVQGAFLGGLAGWIVSIVAVVKRAGRGYGWAGILLGIAAPIIAGVAMVLVLVPYLQGV